MATIGFKAPEEKKNFVYESFVKVVNFIQREFAYTAQVDLQGQFIPYGPANHFPNEIAKLVENSPTATACISTVTDFLAGEGFNQGEDLENLKINPNQTFYQYHCVQADNFAHFWGVATLVKYSKTGRITEFYDLPFGHCRLGRPDSKGIISKIHYNPYFGTELYKAQDTQIYDVFNPNQVVGQIALEGAKFKGQIYWAAVRRKHPFYPIPDYYSAKHWMNIEKNAAVYYDENLENGFLQSAIIKMIGDPNDPSGLKDGNDKDIPKGKAFSDEMTKNFAGAGRNAKLLAMWGSNKEEWPEIVAFPSNANADMYRVQDEHATKKITIATKVPAILANISEGVSLGGDGNTIRAAVKLMQQRVKRPQSFLTDYYANLLLNLVKPISEPVTIVPYSPFPELETVDPQIWDIMTPEEQRKWANDHTEIEFDGMDDVPETQPVQNITNLFFNSYPQAAKDNVQRAIDWQDKMDVRCLKPAGLKMSEDIINGKPLGQREIKRLANFLSKNLLHKDKPYDQNCESLMYDAWGGSDMMTWANEKLKELNGKAD